MSDDPQPDRVMLDIETLGLDPGCAIVSIGAIRFEEQYLGDSIHIQIDRESCQEAGLTIDDDTLEWWRDQSEAAQEYALTGGMDLTDALDEFAAWFGDADEIWANSPAFDCVNLAAAYDAVGSLPPWEHWQRRDCRTLAKLPIAPDLEQDGTEHHALDDAQYQARVVGETLRRINGGEYSD